VCSAAKQFVFFERKRENYIAGDRFLVQSSITSSLISGGRVGSKEVRPFSLGSKQVEKKSGI
jgi:hypothetical protein